MYLCECGTNFTRSDNLRRHQRQSCKKTVRNDGVPEKRVKIGSEPSTSSNEYVVCKCCNQSVRKNEINAHKRTLQHRTNSCTPLVKGVYVIASAFKNRIISYRVHSDKHHTDFVSFFGEIKCKVVNLLKDVIGIHKAVKVNMEVFGRYVLDVKDLSDIKTFNTTNKILDQSVDLITMWNMFVDMMMAQTTEFQERDSGRVVCVHAIIVVL